MLAAVPKEMLVHTRARRHGVGALLMRAVEDAAAGCGRTLLVLDAVTQGDAAGATSAWCSTTVFFRRVAPP